MYIRNSDAALPGKLGQVVLLSIKLITNERTVWYMYISDPSYAKTKIYPIRRFRFISICRATYAFTQIAS